MTTPHRKRCKRYDTPGDAHFYTFSCFRRLPLLQRERSCRWALDAVGRARDKEMSDLWAYVVMPEHMHLVVLPASGVKSSEILTTVKQSVTNRALAWLKRHAPEFLARLSDVQPNGKKSHRFWQRGGGYDRNLRSVRDIHEKIRYVHENPVRRGLVRRAVDWPWSSATAWASGSAEPLAIDRASVPPLTIMDDDVLSDLLS